MKLPGFKRISKENFPSEYASIIDGFGGSYNDLAENVTNLSNKNITVEDNLAMFYKDLDITVDSNGTPTVITEFKNTLISRVKGNIVINAVNLTNSSSYPTTAPYVSFSENNKIIRILNVRGLPASTKFRLTLLVLS